MDKSDKIHYITRTYHYDSQDRLIYQTDGSTHEEFVYDSSGNLISRGPAATIPTGTVACIVCGTNVDSTKQFCPNCGAKMADQQKTKPSAAAQKYCPQCGSAVSPGKMFCNSCGAKIS